jgi:P2-related tail formation protein
MANILASGISNREHLEVFDKLAEARFAALEIEKVLIYIIDQVDADALESLATQFDMLGYNGWALAKTEAEKRELLKGAIELHRYKGTPYAIKLALKKLGFPNCEIIEHIGDTYSGDVDFDGTIPYSTGNWATFRIIYDLGNDKGISAEQTNELAKVVDAYKNARSHLVDIQWKADLVDSVTTTETFSMKMIFSTVTERLIDGINYNGAADYNGAHIHKNYTDILEVTEIPVP